ncbi:hypothetical protein ACJRO7_020846, partial [Eucalyptus globulus]
RQGVKAVANLKRYHQTPACEALSKLPSSPPVATARSFCRLIGTLAYPPSSLPKPPTQQRWQHRFLHSSSSLAFRCRGGMWHRLL